MTASGVTEIVLNQAMNFEQVILVLSIAIAITKFSQTSPIFLKFILIGLTLCYTLPIIPGQIFTDIAFLSFGPLVLLFITYSAYQKRLISVVIAVFALIEYLFEFMHYQFHNEIRLLMITPIFLFIMLLLKRKLFHGDFSVLLLLVAYELIKFLQVLIELNTTT